GYQTSPLESRRRLHPTEFQQTTSDIDGTDQARTHLTGTLDALRPFDNKRRFQTTVHHPGFGPRKRSAIVGHDDQNGVFRHVLSFELFLHLTDEMVKSCDFVIIISQIFSGGRGVSQKRRRTHLAGVGSAAEFVLTPGSVSIVGSKPHKKWLIPGTFLKQRNPFIFPAQSIFFPLVINDVKPFSRCVPKVPFARLAGEITGGL